MKTAFLFAGQGSQRVGMGMDFYEAYPTFRETFDKAAEIVDLDIIKLCSEGPAELLAKTTNTQPIMASFAVGIVRLLKEHGITPDMTAGLSLGEYSALYAAGALSMEQILPLLSYRAKVMETACDGIDCGMTAILGMKREALADLCNGVDGVVSIANYNCKGQLVIGGEKSAVDKVSEQAKQHGAKRCMPLNVSGAFHTELMRPAADSLAKYLETVDFEPTIMPVYHNTTAGPLTDGENIKQILTEQVMSSVYMQDTIENMVRDGVDRFIEIGPGKVLGGFVKKTTDVPCYSIDSVEDLKKIIVDK